MEVVASISQGRTAAAQCGLFTHKLVPVIFEPPCTYTGVIKNFGLQGCDSVTFNDRRSYYFQDLKVHCDTTCPVTQIRNSGARSLPSINLFRVARFVMRNKSLSNTQSIFFNYL